jgi:phenylalanyl-tRNA synthetase alpha chain
MSQELTQEVQRFEDALAQVHNERELYEVQVRFLGKKGSVTLLRGQMAKLDAAGKKAFGQAFNEAKSAIEAGLERRRTELLEQARLEDLRRVDDLTKILAPSFSGTLHPITQTRRELEAIFARLGFDMVEGPHVEFENYNFDALNIPSGHPARDMQDTFVVDANSPLVLRSHTSPVQVRAMLTRQPPLRLIMPGTVFRRDDDATHSPMFHQIEGLYVDRGVSMADLKATLYDFVGQLFSSGLQVRLRPSYFPFVEPGAEFDMQCPFCRQAASGESAGCSTCKHTGFIELGGCGMVHPAVFEAAGYDSKEWTGWAFGFGLDRMAMLKFGVRDLRQFFDGDVRFLEQFRC